MSMAVPEVLKWYREMKREMCCRRCGIMHEALIEFHHVEPKEKKHTISHMVHHGYPMEDIKEELTKTAPVCRNCHSMIHYNLDRGLRDGRWPHEDGFHVA